VRNKVKRWHGILPMITSSKGFLAISIILYAISDFFAFVTSSSALERGRGSGAGGMFSSGIQQRRKPKSADNYALANFLCLHCVNVVLIKSVRMFYWVWPR